MNRIVITGGAGFAGSHIVDLFSERYPESEIVVFDRLTYAGDVRNLARHILSNRVRLCVADIADIDECMRIVSGADLVVHAAAESHVDNSFGNSRDFTRTNVLGTHCLLEACRIRDVPRFVHISTDEVYGEVVDGAATENDLLMPTNPYSASKAAAEMVIRGYIRSFRSPVVIVRANNLFGIRQFPEKIVPRFICHMLLDRKLPLHGNGTSRRHYLSARDFADALVTIAEKGVVGETYNIGTHEEYTNVEVARMIVSRFGRDPDEVIEFVPDRPFNDSRYSITSDKIRTLGWQPRRNLGTDLDDLISWYAGNLERFAVHLEMPRGTLEERSFLRPSRAA